jgi:hypothetical protein
MQRNEVFVEFLQKLAIITRSGTRAAAPNPRKHALAEIGFDIFGNSSKQATYWLGSAKKAMIACFFIHVSSPTQRARPAKRALNRIKIPERPLANPCG